MPKILYVSEDNGEFYLPEHVDVLPNTTPDVEGFWKIEVPDVITLTPTQLCGGYGAIAEILLRAKVGKKL